MIDKSELGIYVEEFAKEIVLVMLRATVLKEPADYSDVIGDVWVKLVRDGFDGEDVYYVFSESVERARLMVEELFAQFNQAKAVVEANNETHA